MTTKTRTFAVIGGTGGLGGAIAAAYLREPGARVLVTGATEEEVSSAHLDPQLNGAEVEVLDVRDDDMVKRYFSTLSSLDVLVNAAGVAAGPADFTADGFARTVDINLSGTARACFAAHELLVSSHGTIINFASVMSFRGSATGPAYAASKGGVVQLTKSLATAWGADVTVNAIAPGFMATPLTENIRNDSVRNARIVDHTPAGRWGVPDDLVGAAQFLASASARFVNGVILPVDGGYLTT